jgi:hydroxymethylbilane synthase
MPNSLLSPQKIVIASRESLLAMWQAQFIQKCLRELYPQTEISILGMTTRGDQILDRAYERLALCTRVVLGSTSLSEYES